MTPLTIDDCARLFGLPAARVSQSAGAMLAKTPLTVEALAGADRDAVMVQAVKRIVAPELKGAGQHRLPDWENGWAENRDAFVASGFDLDALIPRYYQPGAVIRLEGEYCRTSPPDFVYRYTEVFRACLFAEYFAGLPAVYEFGCGTGHNLAHLARLGLVKQLYGLDWARPSQEILAMLQQHLQLPIRGMRFDFFNPDPSIALDAGAGVLTFGALEQVGSRHGAFIEYLLRQRPSICVDVVGMEELYDDAGLLDCLALAYHRRRSYLSGYLTALRGYERDGAVEMVAVHRHRFGNQFDDPYSYVVWRPR